MKGYLGCTGEKERSCQKQKWMGPDFNVILADQVATCESLFIVPIQNSPETWGDVGF